MQLEKTFMRIKDEIIKTFSNIPQIDKPGVAVIYNEENISLCNCVNILKEDCESVNFNWFSTKINSKTDEYFVRSILRDYAEMEDVTAVFVLSPLPNNLNNVKNDLKMMIHYKKYEKINIMELVNGVTTTGTRITVLGITKEMYTTSKK